MATATIPAVAPEQTHAHAAPSAGQARLAVTGLCLSRDARLIGIPDFSVDAGEAVALVGPSGSGKTTALMALSLMHRPQAGTILIDRENPWQLGRRARDAFRGLHIGLIFQSFHLVDALDVRGNIALAARCAGKSIDARHLDVLLSQLDLCEIAGERADRISHGQAQRVAVARALFNRPSLILADEPTSALDDRNTAKLMHLLKASARAAGAALVITSHDRRVLDQVDNIVAIGGVL